jgi:hypothetical protein
MIVNMVQMHTRKSLRIFVGLMLSVLSTNTTNVIGTNPGLSYEFLKGWQWSAGRRGSFVNSAFYNSRDDAIVLTGNHPAQSSDCFLAQVSLSKDSRSLEWSRVYKTRYNEACTASAPDLNQNNTSKDEDILIYSFGFSSSRSFAAIHSNYNSNNKNSSSATGSGAVLIGFGFLASPMMDPAVTNLSSLQLVNNNPFLESLGTGNSSSAMGTFAAPRTSFYNNSISPAPSLKGIVFDTFKVQYPVVVDTFKNGDILAASLVSDYNDITSKLNSPDAAMTDVPLGKDFKIFLQRLSVSPEENLFHKRWTRVISTSTSSSVFLSDVRIAANKQGTEIIIIAGITSGRGDGLASSATDEDGSTSNTNADYDGFVSKLYGDTGAFVVAPKTTTGTNTSTGSKRIASQIGCEDRVSGLCVDPPSSGHNGYIYIIGSSEGIFGDPSLNACTDFSNRQYAAFIQQLDLETMEILWVRQLGPGSSSNTTSNVEVDASGVGCVVSKDGSTVFVSGVISNGGNL